MVLLWPQWPLVLAGGLWPLSEWQNREAFSGQSYGTIKLQEHRSLKLADVILKFLAALKWELSQWKLNFLSTNQKARRIKTARSLNRLANQNKSFYHVTSFFNLAECQGSTKFSFRFFTAILFGSVVKDIAHSIRNFRISLRSSPPSKIRIHLELKFCRFHRTTTI